jgi:hypothetical protein
VRSRMQWFLRCVIAVALIAGVFAVVVVQRSTPGGPATAEVVTAEPVLLSETDALERSEATGKSVVATAMTTDKLLVTATPGRGLVAEISATPARTETSDGWVPIDASLAEQPSGRISTRATTADVSLSGGGTGPLASLVGPEDETISLSWPAEYGELPTPTLEDNIATYPEVFDGVDLAVATSNAGFESYLVVRTREAAGNPVLPGVHFDLSATDVSVEVDADGILSAKNAEGANVFVSGRPEQWDSSAAGLASEATQRGSMIESESDPSLAEPGPSTSTTLSVAPIPELIERPDGAASAQMQMDFEAQPSEAATSDGEVPADSLAETSDSETEASPVPAEVSGRLNLGPDMAMLEDPATVFPVVLDPSLNTGDVGGEWGMYWSTGEHWYGSTQVPRVGYDGWSSAKKISRSFYKFDISSISDTQIIEATFFHNQIHSPGYTCDTHKAWIDLHTVNAFSASTRWPGPGEVALVHGNDKERGHEDHCHQASYVNEWNIASRMQVAVGNNVAKFGVGLSGRNEANADSWRKYSAPSSGYPKIEVVYNNKPNPPTALTVRNEDGAASVSYGGKSWVRTTRRPIITATLTDDDKDSVRAHYIVKDAAGVIRANYTSGLIANNSTVPWKITSPDLPADGTYTWTASAIDSKGQEGPAVAGSSFVVDTVAPCKPIIKGAAVGSYGSGVSITMSPGAVSSDPADGCSQGAINSDVRTYAYGYLTSALPLTATPSALAAPTVVTRTGHMGPDWISASAVDIAGNKSAVRQFSFKVMGAPTSHRWLLDGTGNDAIASDPVPLTPMPPAGPPSLSAPGRFSVTDYDPGATQPGSWASSDTALQLNGSSQYAASSDTNGILNLNEGFAVAAWVKLDSDATNADHAVASFPLPGTSLNNALLTFTADGHWRFGVRTSATTDGTWVNTPISGAVEVKTRATKDKWVHLVGVYEKVPSQVRLYVNGLEVANAPVASPIAQPAAGSLVPIRIGASATTGTAGFFDGLIDDVRAYSGPLDPTGAYLVSREIRNPEPTP